VAGDWRNDIRENPRITVKIAYVHALPLEYYPPAKNMLSLLAARDGWTVRVWSTRNQRGHPQWSHERVDITRPQQASADAPVWLRTPGYAAWHLRTAFELAFWQPDVVFSIEPHSALAVWIYYRVMRGNAKLFVHHHEYYAPEDFAASGMRVLRQTLSLERNYLFRRATWISQTNEARLRLLAAWNDAVMPGVGRILPNYPPQAWVESATTDSNERTDDRLRIIYLGSASFEDTFIKPTLEWAAKNAESVSLHVCGDNIAASVWSFIETLAAPNITFERNGRAYENVPALLKGFDVGLVLYKGNTLNFVHNVPNKAIEYLACGLDVWYPPTMEGMKEFHRVNPSLPMTEVDFLRLRADHPTLFRSSRRTTSGPFPFTAEAAAGELMAELDSIAEKVG
jgi:hypothetical protein